MWEGDGAPVAGPMDFLALQVFGRLNNGMGGLDWGGLEFSVFQLGITDIEGLLDRIDVIKSYKKQDS